MWSFFPVALGQADKIKVTIIFVGFDVKRRAFAFETKHIYVACCTVV
jgi:hypothetical protein